MNESKSWCSSTDPSICYEIPNCCSMRGLLSFQILWLLSKSPKHGQEIAEELLKRRGFKPTPGTLYTALTDLRKRGYIQREKKGRIAIYHLVEEKREEIDQACHYFCHVFSDIFEDYLGEKL